MSRSKKHKRGQLNRCKGKLSGKRSDCVEGLRNDERAHTEKKSYGCKQCGKCFYNTGNLRRHERVHTGEKPYECKQCGKFFSQAGNLTAHERVHTGEKPYECKQCGKSFSQTRHLSAHERVHTGEKPYECKQCGKCFSQAGNLTAHERVHTGECVWQCYSHLESLRNHGRTHKGTSDCIEGNLTAQSCSLQDPQTRHVEKHICWICQEELCSEVLLIEHYENHMISE